MITRDELTTMEFRDIVSGAPLPPITPGEVLMEEFMQPLGLTARALAAEIGVPNNRISAIIKGTRAITGETAILLGRRFETSAEMWMNLQVSHDLALAREAMAA
jgi:addiction module HigA family antidote